MERDKVLIEEFIQGFNDYSGTTYRVTTQPDKLDRQNEAIDAIAYDDSGQILGVEHTLIQPFVGEKDDARRLLTAIAHSKRTSLSAFQASRSLYPSQCGQSPKDPTGSWSEKKSIAWFRGSADFYS